MLRRVSVQNYKAIGPGQLDLELAPITILVGKNGTGKSSVLEAIALTAQSATEDERRSDLILSGDKIDIPHESAEGRESEAAIYFGGKGEGELSCGIEVDIDPDLLQGPLAHVIRDWLLKAIESSRRQTAGYTWSRMHHRFPQWSHEYSINRQPIVRVFGKIESESKSGASIGHFVRFIWQGTDQMRGVFRSQLDRVLPRDPFQNIETKHFTPQDPRHEKTFQATGFVIDAITETVRGAFQRIAFLSALRGRQLMHRDVGPEVRFAGKHGDMTVRLLSNIQARDDTRLGMLRKWASEFGLPDLDAGWAGDQQLKVTFRDDLSGSKLALDHAAGGSVNGLMLAAQLLFSPEGSCLLIEEPEVSMNPGFERKLPGLFVEAVRQGNQVIAATHSEVLVAAMGNAVRKKDKELKPDEVAVYELSRDAKHGVTATKLKISDRGYLDRWVTSFAEVEQELFNEWAESLPEARDEAGPRHRGGTRRNKSKSKPRRSKRGSGS